MAGASGEREGDLNASLAVTPLFVPVKRVVTGEEVEVGGVGNVPAELTFFVYLRWLELEEKL